MAFGLWRSFSFVGRWSGGIKMPPKPVIALRKQAMWAVVKLPRNCPAYCPGAMSVMPKPTSTPAQPAALMLAQRLRGALARDPDFKPDDLPAETGGVMEPGAVFHVTGADGRVFRIRVNRTA